MNIPAMHRLNTGMPLQSCDIPALDRGSQQSRVSVSVHVFGGCGAPALWADLSAELMGTEQYQSCTVISAIISASVYQTGNLRPMCKSWSNSITPLQTHYTHTYKHSSEHRRNSHSHLEVLCWAFIVQLNCDLIVEWRLLVKKST